MIHTTTPLDIYWFLGCFVLSFIGWVSFIITVIGIYFWSNRWFK